MSDWRSAVAAYLTPPLREALRIAAAEAAQGASELRIGAGSRPALCGRAGWTQLAAPETAAPDVRAMADAMLGHAAHARQEELRQGYVTLPGGHRAGLCGRARVNDGKIASIADIASIVVRIAREIRGCAEPLLPHLLDGNRARSTLIVSPPGFGKTTLLRDAARLLALKGLPVAVVDERSEIAACAEGMPTLDIGALTNALDGCPKAEGMRLALRAYCPRVIVTDEIGDQADALAVSDAVRCGVAVIASAHGRDFQDLEGRPAMQALIRSGAFERVVALSGVGQVGGAFDARGGRIG